MEAREIIVRPIITEKTYQLIELNKYSFEVDKRANKPQIAKAVEEIFEVKVKKVNTLPVHGKKKRRGRIEGTTRSWKKAIVTLVEGDRIEVFEGGQA